MRRIALVVALCLVVGGLAVAGGQGEAAAGEAAQPEKITFIADNLIPDDLGLEAVEERFKELTGVELDATIPPHQQYTEKLQVIAASGDMPDAWQVSFPHFVNFALEGVNVPLDDYVAQSNNIKRFPDNHLKPYQVKGQQFGVPFNAGGGTVTFVRQDWLDVLGLDSPTTIDEFIEVAKAFTFDDPDQNGRDDTIGYTSLVGQGYTLYWSNLFQGATFGFVREDGTWIDGFVQPNMKRAIERVRRGYEEGWIDSEIFTNQTSTCRNKFFQGNAGLFTYWAGSWGQVMHERTVEAVGPQADVVALPPMEGSHYWNRTSVPICVSVKAEDPKFVFDTLIDQLWDQGDVQFLFIHGVEGVHWTKENGRYEKLPQLSNPERTFKKTFIHPELQILPLKDDPFTYNPKLTASVEAHTANIKQLYEPIGGEVYSRNVGDLNSLRAEVFSKIVAGQYTIEKGYQAYEDTAKELGIDQMLVELNSK